MAVRKVIEGLADLEQRASDTVAALGRRDTGSYTQAENDWIRALLQSYLNYRSVLLRLLGYYSSFETLAREDLRLKSFLLAYVSGLTLFREGIVLVTTFRDRPLARAKLNEPEPVWGIPPDIFGTVYSNITSFTNIRLLGEAWDFYTAQSPRMAHHRLTDSSEFAWLHDTIRQQQRFIEGERGEFPLVRILGRDTLPPDEIVRTFARQHSRDRQGEAVGLPAPRQLDFVLFLDGDFWSETARFANVEAFIRSGERPVPGPAEEERRGREPGQ